MNLLSRMESNSASCSIVLEDIDLAATAAEEVAAGLEVTNVLPFTVVRGVA